MRRVILGVMAALALTVVARAADEKPTHTAVKPASRMNQKGWADRHQKFLDIAKKGGVDVVFLGDSITQGWEGNGKAAWQKTFEPLKAANFGIGGDQTQHVLWRITEGKELEGIDPKVFVVMIGTNNVGGNKAEEIADGVGAIVKELQKQKPEAKILLLGVFPRSAKPLAQVKDKEKLSADELHPKIKEVNEIIKKLGDGKKVVYLDINDKLKDKEGGVAKEVMYDYLHLNPKGYEIWAEAIAPRVKEMLGK